MNLFKINNKQNFIQQLVSFIDQRFSHNFAKLKILLPSGLACSYLRNALIEKHRALILPKIITITDLAASKETAFFYHQTKTQQNQTVPPSISPLQEKIILANVIHSCQKLGYNFAQSLRLSSSLASLFFELEANNIKIKDLKIFSQLEQSAHWERIYHFLLMAEEKWQKDTKEAGKNNLCQDRKFGFDLQINQLRDHPEEKLIIAGIVATDKMTHNFIQTLLTLENGYYILPPYPQFSASEEKLDIISPLYRIRKNIKLLGDVQPIILDAAQNNILNRLVTKSEDEHYSNSIEYTELANHFMEAEYIALRCKTYLEKSAKDAPSIAIIVHSTSFKEQLILFLQKYQIAYEDLFGRHLLEQNLISLLCLVTEMIFLPFNLQRFFNLLSHPELQTYPQHQNYSLELKNFIQQKCPLAPSMEIITPLIKQEADPELQTYYLKLIDILPKEPLRPIFHLLFEYSLKSLEKLIDSNWQNYQEFVPILSEIFLKKWSLQLANLESFPEILTELLAENKILNQANRDKANLIICQARDVSLLNYELVIISELNEDTYPKLFTPNPWLNLQMQKELKLDSQLSEFSHYLYEFYLNLQNKQLLLTRAKKNAQGQTMISPFILRLKHILKDKLSCKTILLEKTSRETTPSIISNLAASQYFPTEIFATDLERLICAPYNFYAKKILKLRKKKIITDQPDLADFGNFFHKIAEIYSKNSGKKTLEEISEQILAGLAINTYYKKTWQIKIKALATEFSQFEASKRAINQFIYCELKGSMSLNIADREIKISAIADRIEVDKAGNINILDYKTGAIPTKKEINNGLAPQMLIEAMILAENGFAPISYQPDKIITLTYVKLGSQSPYLQLTELKFSIDELKQHRAGLISLLEHYLIKGEYSLATCLSKYDDYQHLARRLNKFAIN